MTEEASDRTAVSEHDEATGRIRRDEIIVAIVAVVFVFVAGAFVGAGFVFGIFPAIFVAVIGFFTHRLNSRRRVIHRILVTVNSILALLGLALTTYYVSDRMRHAEIQPTSPAVLEAPTAGDYYRLHSLDTRYYLVAPSSGQNGGPYPVVVLLHGSGGSGPEIMSDTQWDHIARDRGWLLIAPKSPDFTWEANADQVIVASLNDVAKHYQIDASHILLTGRSDGGTQCYRVGLRYPEVFKAIAPAAAANWPLKALHAVSSRRVDAYIYHAADDATFDVDGARSSARLLQMTGHEVHYHEAPKGGHDYPASEAQTVAEWFAGLE